MLIVVRVAARTVKGGDMQEVQIDKTLLDKIIKRFDFEGKDKNKNVWEIVNDIYDYVYMYFKLVLNEEKVLREKYENKVIEKVKIIDELEKKIEKLTSGEERPEEDPQEIEIHPQLDMFPQGSEITSRDL